jgi:hypothetical protein
MTTAIVPEGFTLIEPRYATDKPLVEIQKNADLSKGAFVPTGRRMDPTGYGLTNDEDEMYGYQSAELAAALFGKGEPQPNDYRTSAEAAALAAAGIDTTKDAGAAHDFVAKYRAEHPWPTSFASLPDGHPCSNYAPVIVKVELTQSGTSSVTSIAPDATVSSSLSVSDPAPAITHVEQLTPAIEVRAQIATMPTGIVVVQSGPDVPVTHLQVPTPHVNFMSAIIADVKNGVVGAEHRLAAAWRAIFPHHSSP